MHDWPARRLLITAVDADTGELVVLDRDAGVPLPDAVTASCAVPGVWPVVEAGGRRLVDGGALSFTHASLAAGASAVTILVPTSLDGPVGARLPEELAALGEADVHLIVADDASLAAIGPNPLDPARRADALVAGLTQAASIS